MLNKKVIHTYPHLKELIPVLCGIIHRVMDQEFSTSFIPKKPIESSSIPASSVRSQKRGGLLMLLSIIIFFVSLFSAVGVYLYKNFLTGNISEMKVQLERAKISFDPNLITELEALDKRINSAETILGAHVAVSPILKRIGDATLPSIRYTKFSYRLSGPNNSNVDVTMEGVARGYNSIALEADLLGKDPFIKNPIFSNFVLDKTANVTFNLTFTVDHSFALYASPVHQQTTQ